MDKRVKIKVIKKGETKNPETPVITEEKPENDNTVNLTSTVSGWINEFQQRRHEEKETAMEQFYSWARKNVGDDTAISLRQLTRRR